MRLRIETRALADLKPYERNNKKHPQAQIDTIKASIQRFGFNDPIGVTESGTIVEGHGRLLAAEQLGLTEVTVIVLPDEMTEDMIDLYRIAHNKIALNSTFDFVRLREELEGILATGTIGLADMGIDPIMAGRIGIGPSAEEMQSSPPLQNTADGVGLEFQIVWESRDDRDRFVAFGEKVKATYGGSLGSAMVALLRDVRAGTIQPTGLTYNPAATAADAENLSWDV